VGVTLGQRKALEDLDRAFRANEMLGFENGVILSLKDAVQAVLEEFGLTPCQNISITLSELEGLYGNNVPSTGHDQA
jgi:hypothetical protein